MVKIPTDIKQIIEMQKPIPIATSSADGIPNVALVGLLKILDDETILIANNYFKKTETNINENPKISLVVYDAEKKKAFQIKGSVEMVTSGKMFEDTVEWVHSRRPDLSPKSAVIVHVEEIYDSKSGPHAGERIL